MELPTEMLKLAKTVLDGGGDAVFVGLDEGGRPTMFQVKEADPETGHAVVNTIGKAPKYPLWN